MFDYTAENKYKIGEERLQSPETTSVFLHKLNFKDINNRHVIINDGGAYVCKAENIMK